MTVSIIEYLDTYYPADKPCTNQNDTKNCIKNSRDRGSIISLDISNQNLIGTLNLTDFDMLTTLNVSYNTFYGSSIFIPSLITNVYFSHNTPEAVAEIVANTGYPDTVYNFNFNYYFLERLDLSYSKATNINCYSSSHLSYLDVSGNPLLDLANLNLTNVNKLSHLNISDNLLKNILDLTTETTLQILDCSNNQLGKILLNASELNHLDVSNNYLTYLNLKKIVNLTFLNCSNNTNLGQSTLTLPNNFKPLILDCSNTALSNITFSNGSVFDCEIGGIVSGNYASPTIVPTSTAVNLELGLGLGIPLGVIFLSLLAFFRFK